MNKTNTNERGSTVSRLGAVLFCLELIPEYLQITGSTPVLATLLKNSRIIYNANIA